MSEQGPIHLEEDGETGDRFLVYESGKGARLDIRFEGETLWMTQEQIARLFGVTRQAVNGHIVNVYGEGELDRESTCKEILQVRLEGSREVKRPILIHLERCGELPTISPERLREMRRRPSSKVCVQRLHICTRPRFESSSGCSSGETQWQGNPVELAKQT